MASSALRQSKVVHTTVPQRISAVSQGIYLQDELMPWPNQQHGAAWVETTVKTPGHSFRTVLELNQSNRASGWSAWLPI